MMDTRCKCGADKSPAYRTCFACSGLALCPRCEERYYNPAKFPSCGTCRESQTYVARRPVAPATLAPEQWDRLARFDDAQLRQWVMVGRAMTRKAHDSPIENALRHVEGNRIAVRG